MHMHIGADTSIPKFSRRSVTVSNRYGLSDDEIRGATPSVFAEEAHDSRSARYTYIPTSHVLTGLRKEGFVPYEVSQGGCRTEGKEDFTKHMMRLRRADAPLIAGASRELILLNSHDGTSAYKLMSGYFRFVCKNGLICGDEIGVFKVPHKGNIVQQVIDAAYQVVEDGAKVDGSVRRMDAIELSVPEQEAFATAALALRFPEDREIDIDGARVNRVRRTEDVGSSLWMTFNRTQENLMRGGIAYTQPSENRRGRVNRTTREVRSIDGNVNLNRALWTLAAAMQEIKTR